MDVTYERCCGIDVHKRSIVACLRCGKKQEIRTFGTTSKEIRALAKWLWDEKCQMAAMESTGSYWNPVYNLLSEVRQGFPRSCEARALKKSKGSAHEGVRYWEDHGERADKQCDWTFVRMLRLKRKNRHAAKEDASRDGISRREHFDTYVCDEAVPAFEKNVAEAYTAKIGYASSLYVANIADGAHRL